MFVEVDNDFKPVLKILVEVGGVWEEALQMWGERDESWNPMFIVPEPPP